MSVVGFRRENTQSNVDYWGDRCCRAEAEIERLRAALTQIASMDDEENEWDGRDRFHRVRNYARNTLNDETIPAPIASQQFEKTEK